MKFFVPHTNDVQGQEQLYRLVRGNIESQIKSVSPRRIWRTKYCCRGEKYIAEVGRKEPLIEDDIFAIFLAADGSEAYICTPTWGMFNGCPIIIQNSEILSIDDFDLPWPRPGTGLSITVIG